METIVDVRSQVHDCLRFLADHCDGARENDHEGFNKLDARFGRQLADAPQLSLAQMVVGAKMIRKYRRQLDGGDLHIPTNQEIEAYLAEQKRAFRERVVGPVQASSLSLESSESKYRVSVEQERIFIEYPYDRAIYEAIRPLKQTVSDWAFDRYGRKEWSYPLASVNQIIDALQPFEHKFFFTSEISAVIEQERQDAEQARQEEELEQAFAELERVVALDAVKPYLNGEPIANGQILYTHQREAVRLLIERKRLILAHDLGLGKTRSALIAAKGYGLPIFVVCPASVQINWLREAEMVQVPIEVYSWAKLPEVPEDHDYILIGDECFPYNTQIMTDHGQISIGEVVEKALPVSVLAYDIENRKTEWKPITRYVKRTLQGHLVRVVHEHGSFICTPNHKIWTEEQGYVEAGTLQSGTHLRILPEHIHHPEEREEHCQVLQQVLCDPIAHQDSSVSRDGSIANEQTTAHQNLCMVSEGILFSRQWREKQQAPILQQALRKYSQGQSPRESRAIPPVNQACTSQIAGQQASRCIVTHEAEQPDEQSGSVKEDAPEITGTYIPCTWREWRTYYASNNVSSSIAITYRIPYTDSIGQREIPFFAQLLQSGSSQSGAQSSHRSRREDSSREEMEVPGPAQNRNLECSRMVRVEVYQPESSERTGPSDSGNPTVYNLEVLDNHNYIADGILVSNCHYAQNITSRRTKGFLALAEHARAVYALTGTPLKNAQPINLYPLLVACKHPLAESLRGYERRYCNGHYKSIGRKHEVFDATGASNLDELHRKTRDVILYKRKEECLKDLPPKIRLMRQAEVDHAAERAYHAMIDRLWQEHDARMEQKREERLALLRQELASNLDGQLADDVDEAALLDELAEDEANAIALVELGFLLHAGSLAKVDSAIAIAQEILAQGESIVLFCAFRDTAAKLTEALDAECLSGDVKKEERQAMIDRFQAKQTRVLVCMIGAGGVGITLTAAQTVVLVDRPWTPGDAKQCEDRLHRIGQVGSVTAIWLQYGPADEKIDPLLQQKQERIDLVLQGKRKTMRGVSRSIRSMAKEILESIRLGTSIEEVFDLVDEAEAITEEQPYRRIDVAQPMIIDSTIVEIPQPTSVPVAQIEVSESAQTTWLEEPVDVSEREKPKSQVVKVMGSSAMREYLQEIAEDALDAAPAAYERVVKQRPITFQCVQCTKTVTQWRYPSRGPRYCSDECRDEAHKEQTKERVRRYRERKGQQ